MPLAFAAFCLHLPSTLIASCNSPEMLHFQPSSLCPIESIRSKVLVCEIPVCECVCNRSITRDSERWKDREREKERERVSDEMSATERKKRERKTRRRGQREMEGEGQRERARRERRWRWRMRETEDKERKHEHQPQPQHQHQQPGSHPAIQHPL